VTRKGEEISIDNDVKAAASVISVKGERKAETSRRGRGRTTMRLICDVIIIINQYLDVSDSTKLSRKLFS